MPLLPPLLADKLTAVGKRYADLAPLLPALTPPALNSVGDKLTDSALRESIARRGEAHRPYLRVRMPRFPLADGDLQTLVNHLIDADRVPSREGFPRALTRPPSPKQRNAIATCSRAAGSSPAMVSAARVAMRLAASSRRTIRSMRADPICRNWSAAFAGPGTTAGYATRRGSCRAWRCRRCKSRSPAFSTANSTTNSPRSGTSSMCRASSRRLPNPIRALRHSGNNAAAEPIVLTDILHQGERTRIKPFLIGLANRHNVLFDWEIGGLSQWSAGDVARQHTRGKAWFWEPAGTVILDTALTQPDLSLMIDGRELTARPLGQFVTEADAWQTEGSSIDLHYRLSLPRSAWERASGRSASRHAAEIVVRVRRKFAPVATGFAQELTVQGIPAGAKVCLRLLSADSAAKATCSPDGRIFRLGDRFASRIVLTQPAAAKFIENGRELLLSANKEGVLRIGLRYESEIPIDHFPDVPQPPAAVRKGESVEIAPGFSGERLPLPPDIMPTGLCWRPDGRLVFSSLKGQVFEAIDTDKDGIEDRLQILADGLPAPYGVHAEADHVDISAKDALLRLLHADKNGRRIEVIASGWGYSSDYHDWTVGLPRNERGEYFLGIPCQQDKRSPAAARFHGNVLRLTPRKPTLDDPRLFTLTPISAGHRFPMGLALDRDGELFVTDNQGNYKPFNELNHVRPGAHFGFINALERGKAAPPRTPSAIDIPHPWTRSVNGICFLYTPKELRRNLAAMCSARSKAI